MVKQEAPSRLHIATEIYKKLPIHKRAVTAFSQSIASQDFKEVADRISNGDQCDLTTQETRASIVRQIRESSSSFRLWGWGESLLSESLRYAITNDTENFCSDAYVAFLFSSESLAHWGRGEAGKPYSLTSYIDQLESLAKNVLACNTWDEIVGVAKKYFDTPLAEIMYKKSLLWNREAFSPGSHHGKAVDTMIASVAALTKPGEVISATREAFHVMFQLELT